MKLRTCSRKQVKRLCSTLKTEIHFEETLESKTAKQSVFTEPDGF